MYLIVRWYFGTILDFFLFKGTYIEMSASTGATAGFSSVVSVIIEQNKPVH